MEIWKTVEGFSKYKVSNYGRIKGIRYGKEYIHKGSVDEDGYRNVLLKTDVKGVYYKDRLTQRLHRLVAKAFVPNPDDKPEVNHKDGNKLNNHADNLEWMTTGENQRHARDIGLRERHRQMQMKPVAKLDPITNEILKIYPSGRATIEDGYNQNTVRACCRGDYGHQTHRGFKWKWVDESCVETIETTPNGGRE